MLEKDLLSVLLNRVAVDEVLAAVAKTTEEDPVLPLPEEDAWYLLNGVLNEVSRALRGGPAQEGPRPGRHERPVPPLPDLRARRRGADAEGPRDARAEVARSRTCPRRCRASRARITRPLAHAPAHGAARGRSAPTSSSSWRSPPNLPFVSDTNGGYGFAVDLVGAQVRRVRGADRAAESRSRGGTPRRSPRGASSTSGCSSARAAGPPRSSGPTTGCASAS